MTTVGGWAVDYDVAGTRARRLGPYDIDYDRLGSRVKRVGALEVEYDRLGTRPKRVLTSGAGGLSSDDLLAVFLVFGVWEPLRNSG